MQINTQLFICSNFRLVKKAPVEGKELELTGLGDVLVQARTNGLKSGSVDIWTRKIMETCAAMGAVDSIKVSCEFDKI